MHVYCFWYGTTPLPCVSCVAMFITAWENVCEHTFFSWVACAYLTRCSVISGNPVQSILHVFPFLVAGGIVLVHVEADNHQNDDDSKHDQEGNGHHEGNVHYLGCLSRLRWGWRWWQQFIFSRGAIAGVHGFARSIHFSCFLLYTCS